MSEALDIGDLETPEGLLIDGANSVDGAPRHHFPQATWWLGVELGVLLLAVWAVRRRAVRLLAAMAIVSAVPGTVWVLVRRVDAPMKRPDFAHTINATLTEFEKTAPSSMLHQVNVAREDDVLFPLGRYAWPARPKTDAGALEIELVGERLAVTCLPSDAGVRCGVEP